MPAGGNNLACHDHRYGRPVVEMLIEPYVRDGPTLWLRLPVLAILPRVMAVTVDTKLPPAPHSYPPDHTGDTILLDFLLFCKLAVRHGVVPQGWDWQVGARGSTAGAVLAAARRRLQLTGGP